VFRRSGIVVLVAATSGLLAACGDSALSQAREACVHVDRSISIFKDAEHANTTRQGDALVQRAYAELRDALPFAAMATSSNGQWNALMTTISESARVGEVHLLHALELQCSVANSNQPALPPTPTAPSQPTPSQPSPGKQTTTTLQNGY
jgi:hypothetical protein